MSPMKNKLNMNMDQRTQQVMLEEMRKIDTNDLAKLVELEGIARMNPEDQTSALLNDESDGPRHAEKAARPDGRS
jgi:hypothetical protein